MPGAPNPATAGQNVPGQASPLQIASLWLAAGGPASQLPTAVAVALAESSGKINASNHNSNGTTDHGLWQINDVNLGSGGVASAYASTIDSPLDNAKAAVAVFNSSGWGAWTTYTSGAYKTYYNQGVTAQNVATATTWNSLMGALLPLVGVGAAALLPESEAAAGAAEGAAGGGGAGTAASDATKLASGAKALTGTAAIAALLTSGSFWLRIGEAIAGIALLFMGLRSLTGNTTTPITVAQGAAKTAAKAAVVA